MEWTYDDGGREAAGYQGRAGDCVTRSIAIASGLPYSTIYDALFERAKAHPPRSIKKIGGPTLTRWATPRDGMARRIYEPLLFDLGFTWAPLMKIGSGCTVHLKAEELSLYSPTLIARLSGHLCAVMNGVVHDTYDPSRDETRCVYGVYER